MAINSPGPNDTAPSAWAKLGTKLQTSIIGAAAVVATASALILPNSGSLDTINGCGLDGSGTNAAANRLKNRYDIPADDTLDASATFDTMSVSTEGKFQESNSAEIEGFVVEAKAEGKEACNCGGTDPQFTDTHIYIGKAPGVPKSQCVIVEITPRLREIMAQNSKDWSSNAIIQTFTGQRVRVSGWLFYDKQHEQNSEVNNPGSPGNWRASCWEIHPVTSIELATPGSASTGTSGGSTGSSSGGSTGTAGSSGSSTGTSGGTAGTSGGATDTAGGTGTSGGSDTTPGGANRKRIGRSTGSGAPN